MLSRVKIEHSNPEQEGSMTGLRDSKYLLDQVPIAGTWNFFQYCNVLPCYGCFIKWLCIFWLKDSLYSLYWCRH